MSKEEKKVFCRCGNKMTLDIKTGTYICEEHDYNIYGPSYISNSTRNESNEINKFWMVYRVDINKGDPTKRHDTIESAKAEAERLCNETRGIFVVLEAIEFCQMDNIIWKHMK